LKNNFKLSRVGITGVRKPINVKRPDRVVTLTTEINVFVNLPATQKGSHLSRNVEIISEIVDQSVRDPVESLEMLCEIISKKLLDRHDYANHSEVNLKADYFLERSPPSGSKSLESYRLIARAIADRDKNIQKKMIGVEVIGMIACPCAMETTRNIMETKRAGISEHLGMLPVVTHNQRNVATLMIEVPSDYSIEADDLIMIVENSFSSPTYEILKRQDEGEVVYKAHENPKFVEDVVRDILKQILEIYTDLPDEVVVTARSESQESIHKHNAFAERVTTLGELRE
jgi:GTP cyclohydrolase-4